MARRVSAVVLLLAWVGCARRPVFDSVLLVTLDTLRADHVSCYGRSPVATPALDGLAQRGARATRAWTPVPLTTPAHASILSGLYPPSHGVRNNARFRLPDGVTTLPEIMKASGAKTAAFVASFTTSRLFGLGQGFDVYDDDMGNDLRMGRRSQRPGDEVVDRALTWLAENGAGPFFLWVHLYDPHFPYEAPRAYAERFPGDPYSAEVAFTDAQVGRLVLALEKAGTAARTVVVAVADHGEGLGSHGEDRHGILLYEETLRVPLVFVAPGRVVGGSVIDAVASTVDVAPTILGLLGRSPATAMQGRDLLAPTPPAPRRVYAETLYPHEEFGWSALYAARDGDLKYIESPEPELFDLGTDAGETKNLASERRAEARQLAKTLANEAGGLVDRARLAEAAGLASGADPETIARLESLGYIAGGAAAGMGNEALPAVGGRSPREAMGDYGRFKSAQEMMREGRYAEAIQTLTALATSDPGNPQVLLKLAQAHERRGDAVKAEASLRELVTRQPEFFLGYGFLSDLLEKNGRYHDAAAVWRELLRLQPGYVAAQTRLARVELGAGRADDALQRLDRHVAAHPQDAEGWALLGQARVRQADAAGAMTAFQRALAIHPTEREAVEGAVELLVKAGRPDEARRLLAGLLARAPSDPLLLQLARDRR
jgi:arylsulfatase A-like enzyme/cytochrome c-type biogenesis protein CcmH/NrfG